MATKHQTLSILFFLIFSICTSSLAEDALSTEDQIHHIIEGFKASHGVVMSWQGVDRFKVENVVFEEISTQEMERFLAFLRVFGQELNKYPGSFFRKSWLSNVIFVKKLFYQELPAQGVFRYPEGYMFFDIYRDFGNELAQRHGIHHEIFHMIDVSLPQDPFDPWASFNARDFVYEKVGRWHRSVNELNYFAPNQPGFVTDYAMISKEEDKAEVYACLFIPSQHQLILQWAQKDEALAKKITHMKELIQKVDSQINDDFWTRLFSTFP